MAKSMMERMLAGELYDASDPEIQAAVQGTYKWLERFNQSLHLPYQERRKLLLERFKSVGENTDIRPPFYCDFACNTTLGSGVFLNYNCIILDVCEVKIGDKTLIGPNVQIYAADHPRDPAIRDQGLENGKPVVIGRNVWIGGGAIILPGVTVGDNAIIGAGSVVTRDVPPGVTVFGNPARPKKT